VISITQADLEIAQYCVDPNVFWHAFGLHPPIMDSLVLTNLLGHRSETSLAWNNVVRAVFKCTMGRVSAKGANKA
jgi:hypothetical protein